MATVTSWIIIAGLLLLAGMLVLLVAVSAPEGNDPGHGTAGDGKAGPRKPARHG